MNRALFLDRDGVINTEVEYLSKIDDVVFVEGIFDLCLSAQDLGYKIIIVTNQSGIARGYYSEDDFWVVMKWMSGQFRAYGVNITSIYFCPHHPHFGNVRYKKQCGCRKPKAGMIEKAAEQHSIDLPESLFVGDKSSDMKAAISAGIGTRVLLRTGHKFGSEAEALADFVLDFPGDVTKLL